MRSAAQTLLAKRGDGDTRAVKAPVRKTFVSFLEKDAQVPIGGGEHGPYSFEGREALLIFANHCDKVIGSDPSTALADFSSTLAGGAQFGKTVLELNLAAYLTSQRWLNSGVFLPSDDLVQGIVDTKFRPDIVDRIDWFADMTKVGKGVNKSGKQVDRKGAFLVTDGTRKATGLVLGLQKVPTSYTLDVAIKDELDDIPAKNEKFVKGRLTSSKLRWQVNVGTQRVHGRGQHAKWKGGSQGVIYLPTQSSAAMHAPCTDELTSTPEGWVNPEEAFPGIIRCQLGDAPSPSDPKLTWAGDFRRDGQPDFTVATHTPEQRYYLAHPETGEPLLRRHPVAVHRSPERLKQRNWSLRISQLGIDAIGLSQIVAQFQLAVADPDEMIVFRCDVLALPQSLSQAITPAIIARARELAPFDLRVTREPGRVAYAGLDTGDRCWLTVREVENPSRKRLIYAASIPAADVVSRIVNLGSAGLWDALFLDQRPLVSQARDIALALNGLHAVTRWPVIDPARAYNFGSLGWNPRLARWTGLKCAVVRFDKKQIGQGIEQGFDIFSADGVEKCVPLIRCNREESVDRVVRELLTPAESVNDVAGGKLRMEPALLLPRTGPAISETIESHFIAGSERERNEAGEMGDYVDAVANHLMFANAYSALAEVECSAARMARGTVGYSSVSKSRNGGGRARGRAAAL